jgi:prepilin-type N-terminal cleavage/methylation domain-containing protein
MNIKKAFTLIELLVVMAIIALLIGIVTVGIHVAVEKSKITRARIEVMNLQNAVNSFYGDVGHFPKTIKEDELGKPLTKNEVYGTSDPTGDNPVFGPYFEFKNCQVNNEGKLLDPWGNPYGYQFPILKTGDVIVDGTIAANEDASKALNNDYSVIYSCGPDNYSKFDASKGAGNKNVIGSWQ